MVLTTFDKSQQNSLSTNEIFHFENNKILKSYHPPAVSTFIHLHSLLKDSTKLNTICHRELCLGEIFQWSQCNSQFKHKTHLSTHEQLVHKDVKYQCRHCEYQRGYKKVYHTTHDYWIHKEIKYQCKKCDHKATNKSHLNAHKQSGHEEEYIHVSNSNVSNVTIRLLTRVILLHISSQFMKKNT